MYSETIPEILINLKIYSYSNKYSLASARLFPDNSALAILETSGADAKLYVVNILSPSKVSNLLVYIVHTANITNLVQIFGNALQEPLRLDEPREPTLSNNNNLTLDFIHKYCVWDIFLEIR